MGVRVRVGLDVAVKVGVSVSVGVGWSPIRTTIWPIGPTVPVTSRTCAATNVSPKANAVSPVMSRQNCTTPKADDTNRGEPKASIVHARVELVRTTKPQPKSFNASATSCVGPKSSGLNPGIPPIRQTPGLPSPSGMDASTSRSGRASASPGTESNTTRPTSWPLSPGTTSITTWNPEPAGRW